MRLKPQVPSVVFEVDHPSSQAGKRERSAAHPYRANDVRFVAADFERGQLAPLLQSAVFDPGKRTFWLWEGVTRPVSAWPGSRIALTYLRRKNGRVPRSFFLALLGEPGALGFCPSRDDATGPIQRLAQDQRYQYGRLAAGNLWIGP